MKTIAQQLKEKYNDENSILFNAALEDIEHTLKHNKTYNDKQLILLHTDYEGDPVWQKELLNNLESIYKGKKLNDDCLLNQLTQKTAPSGIWTPAEAIYAGLYVYEVQYNSKNHWRRLDPDQYPNEWEWEISNKYFISVYSPKEALNIDLFKMMLNKSITDEKKYLKLSVYQNGEFKELNKNNLNQFSEDLETSKELNKNNLNQFSEDLETSKELNKNNLNQFSEDLETSKEGEEYSSIFLSSSFPSEFSW